MNIIKKLIIKDIIALKSYKKLIISMFIMAVFFTFLGFIDKKMEYVTYAGIALPISVLGGLAGSVIYEEEKANSDSYIMTFPVNRRDIILSKYMFNLVLIFAGATVVSLISIVCKMFLPLDIPKTLYVMLVFGGCTNLLFILKTPLVYKYGTEKANNIFMIILFAILSIAPVILLFIQKNDPNFTYTTDILSRYIQFIPLVAFILLVIFNIISYKKSYKIYLNKQL